MKKLIFILVLFLTFSFSQKIKATESKPLIEKVSKVDIQKTLVNHKIVNIKFEKQSAISVETARLDLKSFSDVTISDFNYSQPLLSIVGSSGGIPL